MFLVGVHRARPRFHDCVIWFHWKRKTGIFRSWPGAAAPLGPSFPSCHPLAILCMSGHVQQISEVLLDWSKSHRHWLKKLDEIEKGQRREVFFLEGFFSYIVYVLYNGGVGIGSFKWHRGTETSTKVCASQKGFARHFGYTDLETRCLNLPPKIECLNLPPKIEGCIMVVVFPISFPETTKAWNPLPELKPGPTIASADGIMALLGIPTAGPLAGAIQGIAWWWVAIVCGRDVKGFPTPFVGLWGTISWGE